MGLETTALLRRTDRPFCQESLSASRAHHIYHLSGVLWVSVSDREHCCWVSKWWDGQHDLRIRPETQQSDFLRLTSARSLEDLSSPQIAISRSLGDLIFKALSMSTHAEGLKPQAPSKQSIASA